MVEKNLPGEFVYLLLEHTNIAREEAFLSGMDFGADAIMDMLKETNIEGVEIGGKDEKFS